MIARAGEARRAAPSRAANVRGDARRFDEALQAARGEGRRSVAGQGERPGSPSGAASPGAKAPPARTAGARSFDPRESLSAAAPGNPGDPAAAAGPSGPAAAELRAAVRVVPAAVEAARLHGGTQLTLSLGNALGVDLRTGAAGVELTLRPAAALERVAAAELPALVAALRARGLRVGRAEVRAAAGGRAPSGAARRAR